VVGEIARDEEEVGGGIQAPKVAQELPQVFRGLAVSEQPLGRILLSPAADVGIGDLDEVAACGVEVLPEEAVRVVSGLGDRCGVGLVGLRRDDHGGRRRGRSVASRAGHHEGHRETTCRQ